MPWCPKCKCEFEEGIKRCKECDSPLVDEILEPDITGQELLINVRDLYEASVIESKLDAYDIPFVSVPKQAGSYLEVYMGMTCSGIDIFVSPALINRAKDIIGVIDNGEEINCSFSDEYNKKRRRRAWIILFVFLPGVLGVVVGFIIWLLSFI